MLAKVLTAVRLLPSQKLGGGGPSSVLAVAVNLLGHLESSQQADEGCSLQLLGTLRICSSRLEAWLERAQGSPVGSLVKESASTYPQQPISQWW